MAEHSINEGASPVEREILQELREVRKELRQAAADLSSMKIAVDGLHKDADAFQKTHEDVIRLTGRVDALEKIAAADVSRSRFGVGTAITAILGIGSIIVAVIALVMRR